MYSIISAAESKLVYIYDHHDLQQQNAYSEASYLARSDIHYKKQTGHLQKISRCSSDVSDANEEMIISCWRNQNDKKLSIFVHSRPMIVVHYGSHSVQRQISNNYLCSFLQRLGNI